MKKTFSSTQSIVKKAEAPRRPGACDFAPRALVLTWVIFWINTALFLCDVTMAATFGGLSDDISQSISTAQPTHATDETHSERPHHSLDSLCDYSLNVGAATNGVYTRSPTDRVHLEWFAIDGSVAAGLTAVNHSVNLASRATPPPPFRLYLRTLHLLI